MFQRLWQLPFRSFHMNRGGIILMGKDIEPCCFCRKRTPVFGYELFINLPEEGKWSERDGFLCNNCSLLSGMFDNLESEYIERGFTKYTSLK